MLMRSQGRRPGVVSTRRRLGPPARPRSVDGALVIFGGALLLTPGFMTDVFVLLLPPTRALVRRFVVRARPRAASVVARAAARRAGGRAAAGRAVDVDGHGAPRSTRRALP